MTLSIQSFDKSQIKMLPVTIWMNIPSFYQENLFRALINTKEVDLEVIYAHPLPGDRRDLGWSVDLTGYPHQFLHSDGKSYHAAILRAIYLAWQQRNRIHIVNGIWAEPTFALAVNFFLLCNSTFAIYAEAPNPFNKRAGWKRFLQNLMGRFVVGKAAGIIPVGHFGVNHFRNLGAHEEQIYPFGYFRHVDTMSSEIKCNSEGGRTTDLVYVGQLIKRKGIDLLIDAMARLKQQINQDIRLTLAGDGADRSVFENQATQLGLKDIISFHGPVPSDEVPRLIHRASALVLPSRWDGWGLVVNEALLCGVPVVVSDACGSAMLVQHGVNGFVFESGDVDKLTDCLSSIVQAKQRNINLQTDVENTQKQIGIGAAAHYLVQCLQHMCGSPEIKPPPPWEY